MNLGVYTSDIWPLTFKHHISLNITLQACIRTNTRVKSAKVTQGHGLNRCYGNRNWRFKAKQGMTSQPAIVRQQNDRTIQRRTMCKFVNLVWRWLDMQVWLDVEKIRRVNESPTHWQALGHSNRSWCKSSSKYFADNKSFCTKCGQEGIEISLFKPKLEKKVGL